jgi:outer membrane immunogenic protein
MKKSLTMAAAAVAVSLGGFAHAADLARPALKAPPPPPPIFSWTGCYVGAGWGYGMWNQHSQLFDPTGAAVTTGQDNGGRGWFGTAQVGCDWQITPYIVIGAFVDGDWGSIRGDAAIAGIVGSEKLSSSWAGGGRIGFVALPQLLTYVSAGGAQAKFDQINFSAIATGVPAFTVASHTYSGYFIGTGYEYALTFWPGLFWKTEYRYYDYSSDRLALVNIPGITAPGFSVDSHKYVQTIRSELVWRFNWGKAPVVANY